MSLFTKSLFFAALAASSVSFGSNVWTKGTYNPNTWMSSADNFLLQLVPDVSNLAKYTEGPRTPNVAASLTDGVVTKDNVDYTNTYGIKGGSMEWTFEEPVAEFLQLKVFSHWGDGGRDNIKIDSVEVTTDGSTWTALANSSVENNNYNGRLYASLADDGGQPLATNIVGLRINFSDSQENGGVGCTEIEAIGTAKDVPMLNASVNYVAPTKAGIVVSVLGCGEGYDEVDVYVAYGLSESGLGSYACVGTGKAKNETLSFEVRNLQKDTTYYYSCYVENAGGDRSDETTGTFHTTDGSVLTWLGTVSENWSDDLNWDSEEAPAANASLAKIVLVAAGSGYAPANLDISGLQIDDLCIGADNRRSFTLSGKPLHVGRISSVNGSSGSLVIENEVFFAGPISVDLIGAKLRLAGPVHATASDGKVYTSNAWYNNLSLQNPANDFSGAIDNAIGTFGFYSAGALGHAPAETPSAPNLSNSGSGNVTAMALDQNRMNFIELVPAWWLHGKITVNGGVELAYNGPLDDGTWFTSPQGASYLTLRGTALAASSEAYSTNAMVVLDRLYLTTIGAQSVVAQPTRGIQAGPNAVVDLNGADPAGPLATDGPGRQGAPKFLNNNAGDESVVYGPVRLGGINADGSSSVLFGGLGDIRVTGNVYENADLETPAARPFRKKGPGKLTIESAATAWQGEIEFVGDVTLDYSTANTSKLGGNAAAKMGDGTLEVVGNASGTAFGLTGLTLDYGLTRLVTSGNVSWSLASLAMPGQGIGNLTVYPAVDFQAGSGFQLTDPALVNLAGFGGLGPHFTVNGGADWAAVYDGGVVGAIPAASLMDLGPGAHTLSGTQGAVRVAGNGDTTIQISSSLTLGRFGAEDAAGLLYSSRAGGDLTISGDVLAAEDGASSLTIQNWNTNHTLTISSRIAKANGGSADFDLTLVGPGTTILANDENTFKGGPNVFGGGTVKFTSAKCFNGGNGPTGPSALGRAGVWNGDLYCGNGATLEYIGTDPDGAICDRNINASGEITIKANGAGPLTIKHPGPVNPLVTTCRIVLDGDADKGGGILSNENGWGYGAKLNPGEYGEVVKRGGGKWTIGSADGVYGMRTTVEAGVLELASGAQVRSPVIVKSGATLRIDSGATLRRNLTVESGATLDVVFDGATPAVVYGRMTLAGDLKITCARVHEDTVVLVAESGIVGTATAPDGYSLVQDDTTLTLRPLSGTLILMF